MPGTLFVVATPIGNLEDLTFRALRTLRDVDLIAAEDTRRTSRLLAYYDVRKPLVSLREHNEAREAPRLVERLLKGESIALVSDAGTPGISDPGQFLVKSARAAGVTVVPVPGPSAITAALSASGFASDEGFVFGGFPPSSGTARTAWLEELQAESRVIVFFEAPHRIKRTLSDVRRLFGERPIIVAREISKINEIFVFKQNNENAGHAEPELGEHVVIIGQLSHADDRAVDAAEAERLFGLITKHVTSDDISAMKATAAILGVHERKVRKALKQARFAARRTEESGS